MASAEQFTQNEALHTDQDTEILKPQLSDLDQLESDNGKDKDLQIAQVIKNEVEGKTINMDLIRLLSSQVSQSPEEIVLELLRQGSPVPDEVIRETIEPTLIEAVAEEEVAEPSILADIIDFFRSPKDEKEEERSDSKILSSMIYFINALEELTFKEGYKDIFATGNLNDIKTIDKEEVVAVDINGAQITRQGLVAQRVDNQIDKAIDENGQLTQEQKDKIATINDELDIKGSDTAQKRTVIIRGEKKEVGLSINDVFDEKHAEKIRNVETVQEIRNLEERALTHGQTMAEGDHSQAMRRSAMLTQLKKFNEFEKLTQEQKEEINQQMDNFSQQNEQQANDTPSSKPSGVCSVTDIEKFAGKSFTVDSFKASQDNSQNAGVAAAA